MKPAVSILAAIACAGLAWHATAAPPLDQRVVEAAVARASASVVQLRLTSSQGGAQVTTGVVWKEDGWIVTSDFAVPDREAALVAALGDGRQLAARVVAIDGVRKIALLKVDLPVDAASGSPRLRAAEPAPEAARVGQWSLALGRAYSAESANLAIGIVSAVERLGGVALQTDAKTSPANYGGLLVDLEGRALGLIVALPPVGEGRAAAIEYYDSGIGFAIPWRDVVASAERLASGEDLAPGRLGVSLQAAETPDAPAEVAAVRVRSPAAAAGFRPGDRIVAIDGRSVGRGREMSARLKRLYAGTPATLGIVRGDKSLDLTVTPVEKLPPPQWASLGILPGEESAAGLAVRQVLAGGPAEKAELRLGDRLTHVDGQKVESLEQIVFALARKQPGDELKLRVSRDGKDFDRIAVMAPMDATIPAELAPRAPAPEAAPEGAAAAPKAAAEGKAEIGPAEGRIELPIVGRRQPCVAYVPKSGRSPRGVGLLVWLHGPGGVDVDATIDDWKPLCDAHGLALVLPSSDDPRRWSLDDVEDIAEAVRELAERTPIDPFRTAIAGYQTGGAQALRMGLGAGGRFRGVAAIDAPLAAEPPEFNPARPVVFYFATSPASRFARRIEQGIGQLREQGYPIVLRDLGPQPRELTPDERTELARWADSLDRI